MAVLGALLLAIFWALRGWEVQPAVKGEAGLTAHLAAAILIFQGRAIQPVQFDDITLLVIKMK